MPKKEGEDTSRIHLWLYDSDIEWLKAYFGDNVGFSKAVRIMIRKNVTSLAAKGAERSGAKPVPFKEEDLDTTSL